MLENLKILLVGAGSMGSALIKGWTHAGVGGRNYTVVNPTQDAVAPLRHEAIIDWYPTPEGLPADYTPDVIVFAVKPQVIDQILKPYFGYSLLGTTFITVAAGKPLEIYHKDLGPSANIIRVMPNLPVAYNKGMSVGFAPTTVSEQSLSQTQALFAALGEVIWVDREEDFHAVTAISGCGPAYLYLLVKALTAAGVMAGLDPQKAEVMAKQSMIGAGELLAHTNDPMDVLINRVASPGGVTQAALTVLEDMPSGLIQLMTRAITTGVNRSKELST